MFYWKDQDVDGSKEKKNHLPETSRALAPPLYTFTPLLNGSLLGLASGFCEWKQRRHSAPRTAPGFPDTSERPSALLSHKWVNKWNADSRVGGQLEPFVDLFFPILNEWIWQGCLVAVRQILKVERRRETNRAEAQNTTSKRKQVTCYSGFWISVGDGWEPVCIPNNWAPS